MYRLSLVVAGKDKSYYYDDDQYYSDDPYADAYFDDMGNGKMAASSKEMSKSDGISWPPTLERVPTVYSYARILYV